MTQPSPAPRCPVQSSLIAAVGYCPVSCTLDVELRDGSLYRYYGVPASICWGLLCAASKGRYFNRHVKPVFPYQRVASPRHSARLARPLQLRL
jgi:hypothetical protein